jgi:hypothetical protein
MKMEEFNHVRETETLASEPLVEKCSFEVEVDAE